MAIVPIVNVDLTDFSAKIVNKHGANSQRTWGLKNKENAETMGIPWGLGIIHEESLEKVQRHHNATSAREMAGLGFLDFFQVVESNLSRDLVVLVLLR